MTISTSPYKAPASSAPATAATGMSYKDTASGGLSPKASATQVDSDDLNMVSYKKRTTMTAYNSINSLLVYGNSASLHIISKMKRPKTLSVSQFCPQVASD
jgi:predicted TIM-barrel enzyme